MNTHYVIRHLKRENIKIIKFTILLEKIDRGKWDISKIFKISECLYIIAPLKNDISKLKRQKIDFFLKLTKKMNKIFRNKRNFRNYLTLYYHLITNHIGYDF